MKKLTYLIFLFLLSCSKDNYDKQTIDSFFNQRSGNYVSLDLLHDYYSGKNDTIDPKKINHLYVNSPKHYKMKLTTNDFEKIPRDFPVVFNILETDLKQQYDIEYTSFKNLRHLETLCFNQIDLNNILKSNDLMFFIPSLNCSEGINPSIDSIPSYIGDLEKLQWFATSRERYIPYEGQASFNSKYLKYDEHEGEPQKTKYKHVWLPDLPASFSNCPIKYLYLNGFKSNKLPACVGELDELEELVLNGHNFDAGLEVIAQCSNLKKLVLDLGMSQSELPDNFFDDLTDLEELTINWEYMKTMPQSIDKLKNLRELKILYCWSEEVKLPTGFQERFKYINYVFIEGNGAIPDYKKGRPSVGQE